MIVTFLIILFVQGLNCFLEIGFLAGNLEENNLRKYRIIGSQMERKLNKSLVFGKPLEQINYERLLANIIPEDIENLYIIDVRGGVIFAAKEGGLSTSLHMFHDFTREKTRDAYRIHIPLSDRSRVTGNIVMVVSHQEIKEKLLFLVRRSVLTFLVILAVGLPLLYLLLTWFVNRPYYRFVQDLDTWIQTGQHHCLKQEGIDMSPLSMSREQIVQVRSGQWFSPENRVIYDAIDGVDMKPDRFSWENNLYRRLMARMNVN